LQGLIKDNLKTADDPHKVILWRLRKAARGYFKIIDWDNESGDKKPIKFWHNEVNPISDTDELLKRIGII